MVKGFDTPTPPTSRGAEADNALARRVPRSSEPVPENDDLELDDDIVEKPAVQSRSEAERNLPLTEKDKAQIESIRRKAELDAETQMEDLRHDAIIEQKLNGTFDAIDARQKSVSEKLAGFWNGLSKAAGGFLKSGADGFLGAPLSILENWHAGETYVDQGDRVYAKAQRKEAANEEAARQKNLAEQERKDEKVGKDFVNTEKYGTATPGIADKIRVWKQERANAAEIKKNEEETRQKIQNELAVKLFEAWMLENGYELDDYTKEEKKEYGARLLENAKIQERIEQISKDLFGGVVEVAVGTLKALRLIGTIFTGGKLENHTLSTREEYGVARKEAPSVSEGGKAILDAIKDVFSRIGKKAPDYSPEAIEGIKPPVVEATGIAIDTAVKNAEIKVEAAKEGEKAKGRIASAWESFKGTMNELREGALALSKMHKDSSGADALRAALRGVEEVEQIAPQAEKAPVSAQATVEMVRIEEAANKLEKTGKANAEVPLKGGKKREFTVEKTGNNIYTITVTEGDVDSEQKIRGTAKEAAGIFVKLSTKRTDTFELWNELAAIPGVKIEAATPTGKRLSTNADALKFISEESTAGAANPFEKRQTAPVATEKAPVTKPRLFSPVIKGGGVGPAVSNKKDAA